MFKPGSSLDCLFRNLADAWFEVLVGILIVVGLLAGVFWFGMNAGW